MSSPSPRRSVDSSGSSQPPASLRAQFTSHSHDWTLPPRSSSTGRYDPRRPSTASSIHSIGGSLDIPTQNKMGPVREMGHNAISTLLQPPIVRTGMLPHTSASASSMSKPPSSKDIPPVVLSNIPHVENSTFQPYLSQVAPLYESVQRAKLEQEASSQQARKDKDKDGPSKDEITEILERRLRREDSSATLASRFKSSASDSSGEISGNRRRSSGSSKRTGPIVTPLSTIPNVYFDENFHLENPRTFDIVSERSDVVRQPHNSKGLNGTISETPAGGRKVLATNAILQEKLSWYMDTVEVHLISSISTASTSFFAALGSLRELQSEAAESVTKIKTLREDLKNLDEHMAVGGLKIIGMKRRRENLRRLTDTVEQIGCVMYGVSHCEDLIDNGNLETALIQMEVLDLLVTGNPEVSTILDAPWLQQRLPATLTDLRDLRAFDGFPEGMEQLRFRVGKGFEARFLEVLLADLRQHVQNVPTAETLQRWVASSQRGRGEHGRTPSVFPAYLKTSAGLRSDLQVILNGLSASNYTRSATASFRDAIMREMKKLIRQHLPSATDDDTESVTSVSTIRSRSVSQSDKSSILARNLRSLDPESAEELFVKVYTGVSEAIRRLGVLLKVLLDVTSGVSSPLSGGGLRSPPRSPSMASIDAAINATSDADNKLQEELIQALDMSSLLGQAVDAAQSQITKVLRVRSEQTTHLPLQFFLRYFILNRLFADECEAISGRSGAALKGAVNNHISDHIPIFAESQKQNIAQIMENDRWEAKDFGEAENVLLTRILESMTKDPVEWSRVTRLWEDVVEDGLETTDAKDSATNGSPAKEKTRSAVIEEEKYIVTESSIAAVRGIEQFLNMIAIIPSMTTEISAALIEYLKLFNSRLFQLILQAGALKSAGLKNINTKHLALASQALSLMMTLVPYIREFVRRQSSSAGSVLAEFDKVKRLYQDHQVNIHDKLVDIMSGRATVHVKAMSKVDWDDPEVVEQNVSPYVETLVKETGTLHRVLSKHLPESSVRIIMLPVFASYREQWSQAFRDASVATPQGKARLLRDAELFSNRLGKIDGTGDLGDIITDIVSKKTLSGAQLENRDTNGIVSRRSDD